MNKGLILKVLISIIILSATSQGIFWFFKTSATKKNIIASVNSFGKDITFKRISITGFPLKQKISIKNLKFSPKYPYTQYLPNKYYINIGRFTAESSVFTNNFKVTTFDQLSFQDSNGNIGDIIFNQKPIISFVIAKDKIKEFFYDDNGYKIISGTEDLLYKGGQSEVEFKSMAAGENKIRHKIKIYFESIKGIDIFNSNKFAVISSNSDEEIFVEEQNLDNPQPNKLAVENQDSSSELPELPSLFDDDNQKEVEKVPDEKPTSDISHKFQLEMDYLLIFPDRKMPNNFLLSTINIANLELSSLQSYKININGKLRLVESPISAMSVIESCNLTVEIESIDNILAYVKTFIPQIKTKTDNTKTDKPEAIIKEDEDKKPEDGISTATKDQEQKQEPITPQEPIIDSIIMDLAKANIDSNDKISVFAVTKESDSNFVINNIKLEDLITKIFPPSVNNNNNSSLEKTVNSSESTLQPTTEPILEPVPKSVLEEPMPESTVEPIVESESAPESTNLPKEEIINNDPNQNLPKNSPKDIPITDEGK